MVPRKGLMGIEYVTTITILLLLLSSSPTLQQFAGGDQGAEENGDDSPPPSGEEDQEEEPKDSGDTGGGTAAAPPKFIQLDDGKDAGGLDYNIPEEDSYYLSEIMEASKTIKWTAPEKEETLIFRASLTQDLSNVMEEVPARFLLTTEETIKELTIEYTKPTVPQTAQIASTLAKKDKLNIAVFGLDSTAGLGTSMVFNLKKTDLERSDIDPLTVSVCRLDGESCINQKTWIESENEEAVVYVAEIDHFTLFSISAREIVSSPTLCNNNDVCEPPHETEATCPVDCFPRAAHHEESGVCNPSETLCMWGSLYKCTEDGKNTFKLQTCEFGCSEDGGARCLTEPQPQYYNTFLIGVIAGLIIIGILMSVIFLRE